ncbi:coiled-coil domain-containing protein 124 isoform 1-T4 [Cyanocitta cristata]
MPKKFQGENTKSAAARARRAEAKAAADARRQQELEDALWKDEDKHVLRKEQRKEEREKRRLEQLERKKELQRLLEEEDSKLKGKTPKQGNPGKITRAQIEESIRKEQHRESADGEGAIAPGAAAGGEPEPAPAGRGRSGGAERRGGHRCPQRGGSLGAAPGAPAPRRLRRLRGAAAAAPEAAEPQHAAVAAAAAPQEGVDEIPGKPHEPAAQTLQQPLTGLQLLLLPLGFSRETPGALPGFRFLSVDFSGRRRPRGRGGRTDGGFSFLKFPVLSCPFPAWNSPTVLLLKRFQTGIVVPAFPKMLGRGKIPLEGAGKGTARPDSCFS